MIISKSKVISSTPSRRSEGVRLQCPHCGGWIGFVPDSSLTDTTLVCSDCCFKLASEQGIWRSLLPGRAAHFSRFTKEYEFIRSAEGRGSLDADYYLALPFRDMTDLKGKQWSTRARTFRYIQRRILPRNKQQLRILDLGAGNGWLSYRLALQGHSPIAVDLLTNDRDGLAAAVHYRKHLATLFPRVQAELDTLPFTDGEFDLVIYNASFHYSENYEKTIAEALRCTRSDGMILIADTPWYSNESSGQQMVAQRREAFTQRYGFPSDGLNSLEYLTDKRLQRLEACFGIRWQTHTPNYGLRWFMRPLIAQLRGNREPSRFRIYTAKAR